MTKGAAMSSGPSTRPTTGAVEHDPEGGLGTIGAPADRELRPEQRPRRSAPPPSRPPRFALTRRVGRGTVTFLRETGNIVDFAIEGGRATFRRPVAWGPALAEQMVAVLRLCWIPMIISTMAFGLGAPGLQGGNLVSLFGVPDRLGGFFVMASIREFAPWINAMVVAGVVGSAITADLGARRIREEVDAMEVLGVDPMRELVVPRVLALTIMTGLLNVLALVFGIVGGFIASVPILGASAGGFLTSFWTNATVIDLVGSMMKTTAFGFLIGVVCCYKGLHAKGGPAGVGRAVNQAVVISFMAIWIVNYIFTSTMLGLFPEAVVTR